MLALLTSSRHLMNSWGREGGREGREGGRGGREGEEEEK